MADEIKKMIGYTITSILTSLNGIVVYFLYTWTIPISISASILGIYNSIVFFLFWFVKYKFGLSKEMETVISLINQNKSKIESK